MILEKFNGYFINYKNFKPIGLVVMFNNTYYYININNQHIKRMTFWSIDRYYL